MAELREQAELAKTKALLFYEQMKRHRINKIKSKSFHRIKKRQRMRRQAAEEDDRGDRPRAICANAGGGGH